MLVNILQAKIQTAIVTASDVRYEGSITVDEDILDEMGVVAGQQCDVNCIDGFRGTTYFLAGPRGSGCVEANGALASHILKGDVIHINVYCQMSIEAARDYKYIIIESNK